MTWGFLRETKQSALKAGLDADTGLNRTGLEEYLAVIFPNVKDWVHDKPLDNLPTGVKSRRRPDYRSETLKMIVEFDGLQHYTKPDSIESDESSTIFYTNLGYKVVRIPYFIQLSNSAVKKLFNVNVKQKLFDSSIPSIGPKGHNSPAYLCSAGIERMAKEFKEFPEQYKVNINFLKSFNDEFHTGALLLENAFNKVLTK